MKKILLLQEVLYYSPMPNHTFDLSRKHFVACGQTNVGNVIRGHHSIRLHYTLVLIYEENEIDMILFFLIYLFIVI